MTDQLVESPPLELPSDDSFPNENVLTVEIKTWETYFDGYKCRNGSGVGVIKVSLFGKNILLSYHLNFLCTNNTTRYEALLPRLHVLLVMGAQDIKIFDDSQLVIKKINGTY